MKLIVAEQNSTRPPKLFISSAVGISPSGKKKLNTFSLTPNFENCSKRAFRISSLPFAISSSPCESFSSALKISASASLSFFSISVCWLASSSSPASSSDFAETSLSLPSFVASLSSFSPLLIFASACSISKNADAFFWLMRICASSRLLSAAFMFSLSKRLALSSPKLSSLSRFSSETLLYSCEKGERPLRFSKVI